jgi:hypothetical protein
VRKDMQTMKIKNWKKSVWKTIVERTKTDIELWRISRRRRRGGGRRGRRSRRGRRRGGGRGRNSVMYGQV